MLMNATTCYIEKPVTLFLGVTSGLNGSVMRPIAGFFFGNESINEFFNNDLIFLVHLFDGFELVDQFRVRKFRFGPPQSLVC